jgi:hypothetical protein
MDLRVWWVTVADLEGEGTPLARGTWSVGDATRSEKPSQAVAARELEKQRIPGKIISLMRRLEKATALIARV